MPVTISVCMSIASFICVHLHVLCVWEWVGMAALEFSWELHSMRRHVFYTALQWVPHWELAFDPAQWAGQCILHQTAGMGKGQYRMPSKDELVQRYNRMNTIPQTRSIQSRFLQSRNLNCIALCEVITSKDLQKHGNIWVCPVSDHVCTRFFFV